MSIIKLHIFTTKTELEKFENGEIIFNPIEERKSKREYTKQIYESVIIAKRDCRRICFLTLSEHVVLYIGRLIALGLIQSHEVDFFINNKHSSMCFNEVGKLRNIDSDFCENIMNSYITPLHT